MTLTEKVNILFKLGRILQSISEKKEWPGYEIGLIESEYQNLMELVERVHIYNGWFTPDAVRQSFTGVSKWLNEEELMDWVKPYSIEEKTPKKVAIIMAGNIPLVGFHDFLSVFLSGHIAMVKLSSDDQHLFPAIIKVLSLFDERIWEAVEVAENRLEGFDAVIATGSDNSATYFYSYFGSYPHIIRKNRNSVAVLSGKESKEELHALGKDIFTFFGLGCRNVTQMWIPKDFELDRFFEAIYDYNSIVNHNKYANNYDYNKAVYLMNQDDLLDNGFLLLKEDQSIHSPLGMLHYVRYERPEDWKNFIEDHSEKIQAVVGKQHLHFGAAQEPELTDYADGVDTMKFLTSL